MANIKRLRILYIRDFFEEYTDDKRLASIREIKEYLEKNDIEADRKSIYSDIEALKFFYGMQIEVVNGKRYHLVKNKYRFDPSEVILLANCAAASKNISVEQSKILIEKLERFVSTNYWDFASAEITTQVKTTNELALNNLRTICNAIGDRFHIDFKLFQYNMKKEREYRHNGKVYHVFPTELLYENNMFYLIAYEEKDLKMFRIDKMDKVTINDPNERIKEWYNRIDYDYNSNFPH